MRSCAAAAPPAVKSEAKLSKAERSGTAALCHGTNQPAGAPLGREGRAALETDRKRPEPVHSKQTNKCDARANKQTNKQTNERTGAMDSDSTRPQ